MARIRTIKPSFWTDSDVAALRRDARLLLLGLISYADDDGRFPASAKAISGYVFPFDDVTPAQVARWRDEIAKTGIVELYERDGLLYGCFPNWGKHQKISHRKPSTFPEPLQSESGEVLNRYQSRSGGAPQ